MPHLFDPESKDPVVAERGKCLERDCKVRGPYNDYKECTKRVLAKISYTKETCHPETIVLMEALDRCVAEKAFVKMI